MSDPSHDDEDGARSRWHRVGKVADLDEGQMIGAVVEGRNIAVYNIAGTYCATDDVCPHAQALLSDGFLDEGIVECPLHGGRFDVATGRALGPPVEGSIAVHRVKVVEQEIQVSLNAVADDQ